jgi:hypothetical protein
MSALDELIRCGICNSPLKEPYLLPCSHGFCKSCLVAITSSGKITCKDGNCGTVHKVNGTVEKTFKPYGLAQFLMNVKGNSFPSKDDGSITELDGVCADCAPPQKKDAPPPPQVKISACHHCHKVICNNCRNKHYEEQRKTSLKTLDDFEHGSFNIKSTNGKQFS